ncbi:MAG: isoprenoid biosynthesis glyoxalase ElbB [Candidatus Sumerlaeia bacterium]
MARIGVVLSGCGVMDGSEIHEAVLTLLAIDRAGHEAVCMAPNAPQMHVVDHLKGAPVEGESRNILVESARIARGRVCDMATVRAADIDALIFPGGFGAAKNLCTFAVDGPDCTVNEHVARLIREVSAARKPMGFICIAPAIAAKVLGRSGVSVTIGNDPGTATAIEQTGARHIECPADDIVVDETNQIVSTPAYMCARSISEAAAGIEKLVNKVIEMIEQ